MAVRPRGKIRWREVKVGVLARLGQHRTRTGQCVTRLQQRRLVAVLGDIEMLKPRLWLEALRQGIVRAPQVIWLSDGGRGLWRLFEERFAGHARGILDFYHAAQQLWKGAAAWLDGRTTRSRRWFVWARHRLRHGMPDGVLADLTDALDVEGLPATARDTLRTVHAYLERHREHIDYATYKALGLPLGSGMVESACKWLIQQRFKGVGMRWSEDGFNHLLHLRLAWVNGRFEALFGLALIPEPVTAPWEIRLGEKPVWVARLRTDSPKPMRSCRIRSPTFTGLIAGPPSSVLSSRDYKSGILNIISQNSQAINIKKSTNRSHPQGSLHCRIMRLIRHRTLRTLTMVYPLS